MRLALWAAFFVVCNILGVETFKAAITLPFDEALVPGFLSVPLVGLAAFGITRVVDAWRQRER
jgi:methionine-rich copper-binding protein CopC